MKGVAIEQWKLTHKDEVVKWLTNMFGPSTKETWYVDWDYDLFDLNMRDDIYMMYKLTWE